MSEGYGHSVPDSVESDPAALTSAEDLDEDQLAVDPLEEGVEPIERYAFSDRHGTTPSEVREGEPLADRLRQERPDVQPEDPDRPLVADRVGEDGRGRPETLVSDDPVVAAGRSADEVQNADKPGGSMAESLRTPPESE